MSDYNITVEDLVNINVGVDLTPINISTSIVGTKGDQGIQGPSGISGGTSNNDDGINLSGNLSQTGATLISLITAASAGVSAINTKSGILTITGAGSVTVFSDTSDFVISGNTGVYSSFYQKSNSDFYSTSGNVQSTGQTLFNYFNFLSGNLIITGQTLINSLTTTNNNLLSTGTFLYNLSQGTSGNLQTTGSVLNNKINNVSGYFNNNPSGFITGINTSFNLPSFSKSFIIESPIPGDSFNLFYTDTALRVNKLITLLSGSNNQIITFNIRFTTGRHVNSYYSLFNSDQITVNITTGQLFNSFSNNIISGNSYVYLEFPATGGNLEKYSQTMFYSFL